MEIRELDPSDETLMRSPWDLEHRAELASRAYDFHWPSETARVALRDGRPDADRLLLGGFLGETLAGVAEVGLPLLDNSHVCGVELYVDPVHQGRGLGRALTDRALDETRSPGRRVAKEL